MPFQSPLTPRAIALWLFLVVCPRYTRQKNPPAPHTTTVMPVKTGIQAAALAIKQTLFLLQRCSLDTDFRRYDDVSRHSLPRTRSGDGSKNNLSAITLLRAALLPIATFLAATSTAYTGVTAEKDQKNTAANSSAIVRTPQVQARLLAYAPSATNSGGPLWLALELKHRSGWHSYWQNPGDSGLATQLNWTLPSGVGVGPLIWPTPQPLSVGPLTNYGYQETVLLSTAVQLPAHFSQTAQTHLDIGLQANWLVCKTECIPQSGVFSLRLPTTIALNEHQASFEAAWAQAPQELRTASSASFQVQPQRQSLQISVRGLPLAWHGQTLHWFAESPDILAPSSFNAAASAPPATQSWQGHRWTAQLPLSSLRSTRPQQLALVLALPTEPRGVRIAAPVRGSWPVVASAIAIPAPALPKPIASSAPAPNFIAALLGALLGGLILNLMPCVFPVLALKLLSLQSARPADRWINALGYSAGVLLSFLALGALLLTLRAGGSALGWGFQLQSPVVIASLSLVFTLLSLNLLGFFSIRQLAPQRWASWQSPRPGLNAFCSGALATAIAAPCTAPFMGSALGVALTLPALPALSIFGTLALGMATPYFIISAWPQLAQRLPRPGAWMHRLKQLLALPLLATVAWLLWVFAQQSSAAASYALLSFLIGLALLLSSLSLQTRWRTPIAIFFVAVCLILAGVTAKFTSKSSPPPNMATPRQTWQAWQPGLVPELLAQGRSVFVDFTAAWCITCQYNKLSTLSNEQVLADFRAQNIVLLRADWTLRSSAITQALAELGRSGVPTYALYRPGQAPLVLPELLTVDKLRQDLVKPRFPVRPAQ